MILLTINDKKIEVEKGTTILRAAESAGIKIPTLCDHKALAPYGACRLCLVEISQNSRASSIQASCTYPASEGLVVQTDSERVLKTRRIMIELLLARRPDSEVIQRLAKEWGAQRGRIKSKQGECILCGLCVRMCEQRMGKAAIGFIGRGSNRTIGSPFGTPSEVCQICGACQFVCPTSNVMKADVAMREPVPIGDEYNADLVSRSAIYIPYPQAVPNKAAIDERFCVHQRSDACGICKEFCEAEAIDFEQKEERIDLNVGAVVLSPGYEVFDANSKEELGYSRYPNVMTAIEFERLLSASGPFEGHIQRPSDNTLPKKIAFIQCVGSRDVDRNYCSSVCCMYATKEAIIAKEHEQDIDCTIFYIDLRAFSKGFEAYYERAKELGIRYIRCKPSSIKQVPTTKDLRIQYQADDGKITAEEFNMVVLSTGLCPPKTGKDISERFSVKLNEHGFCHTEVFTPVESTQEGIYVCGPFTEPKDIPESVMQSSAAASKVLSLLKDAKGSLITQKEYPPQIDVEGQEPRIGVFVCHCGANIGGFLNVPDVVEYAKTLDNVVYATDNVYTCSNDTQEAMKEIIKEHNLNRVIVASCSPRTHEPLFRNTIREAGLNPYLFEMANIRDQCSWVHMEEPQKATRKAKDLVRMAVAKSRLLEPLEKASVGVTKAALVIGGGLAGMTAALEIANQDFQVYLVERDKELGGNLRNIHYLLNGEQPGEELRELIDKVQSHEKIRIFIDATIKAIEGFSGNFKTMVETNGKAEELEHGVVIVATGGKEYQPEEYLYGQDERAITQLEFENRLSSPTLALSGLKSVVMIQCVGSRDKDRPYCSRICCSEAVKNALKMKELNPSTNVYVLYRDIRTYGFRESYFRKAREKGVIFIRYEDDQKPQVVGQNGQLRITVTDSTLNMPISIGADLLVLSAAIVAEPENKSIAQFLKVPLNQDGFFLEAHMKLRPVDFASDGIFLCGLAHSAKSIDESIIQAQAAAGRASTILSRDSIELEANISSVIDKNCDGCAYCIDPCPYDALALIEYMRDGAIKKTVELNESACKGCGTCQATCPKQGILVKGFTLEQISAQVGAALEPVEI